jgi:hypothetical protein
MKTAVITVVHGRTASRSVWCYDYDLRLPR